MNEHARHLFLISMWLTSGLMLAISAPIVILRGDWIGGAEVAMLAILFVYIAMREANW